MGVEDMEFPGVEYEERACEQFQQSFKKDMEFLTV